MTENRNNQGSKLMYAVLCQYYDNGHGASRRESSQAKSSRDANPSSK